MRSICRNSRLLLYALLPLKAPGEIFVIEYQGFQVWVDSNRRGAVRFEYTATVDTGNLERHSNFHLDGNLHPNSQQTSTGTYSAQPGYDRGHLVPANHLDHLPVGIRQPNFMTNIR